MLDRAGRDLEACQPLQHRSQLGKGDLAAAQTLGRGWVQYRCVLHAHPPLL